jgi:hypothetical protein
MLESHEAPGRQRQRPPYVPVRTDQRNRTPYGDAHAQTSGFADRTR